MMDALLHVNLFPFYALGIAFAMWLSTPDNRALDLSITVLMTYAAVKLIGIWFLKDLGMFWYIACGLAQFWIMMQADGRQLEFRLMRGLCVAAMTVNAWAYLTAYHHSHWIYWLMVNSIQVLQVTTLCACSPVAMLVLGHWLHRHRIRRPSWFVRLASERVRFYE